MRIVGVIPSRWASTRFPGKSLALLCGKPLIQWVLEGVSRAKRLDAVLVATDDDRIRAAVERLGGTVAMTRPDHPSGTDRIAEAVAGMDCDVVINIQGDEPLIDPRLIDRIADLMAGPGGWDMATAATPITNEVDLNNPSVVKVVWDENHRALYFSRARIPHVRDLDSGGAAVRPLHWRHIGIYAYRNSFLQKLVRVPPCALEQAEKLEQLRALHIGVRMAVLETEEPGIGVDTPQDVNYVEEVIRQGGLT